MGELTAIPSIVDDVAGSNAKVFLVTGRRSLRATGTLQRVVDQIGPDRITLYEEVAPYPSPKLAERALGLCRASSADVVVSVGGGSALDLAKTVAIMMGQKRALLNYVRGGEPIQNAGLPFIAVPTTSGSSSEVTPGAALWDMKGRNLFTLNSPLMFPTVAIVDPMLAMTMPKALAAATGMDAFTSAFEAYWSREAGPVSDALSLEVIRMFAQNLERSCIRSDLESRTACSLAATMSGIAYSNSRPNACHAIGSPLTIFWGIGHGQSVGVTLTSFLKWIIHAIPHKLSALWRALGVSNLDEAVARIDQIMDRCGLETRLRGLGIGEDDVDLVLDNIRWDRMDTLPRPFDRDDADKLLRGLV